MQTITISSQFCGPPTSANGGVAAGRLAHYLQEFLGDNRSAIEVTLHAPPPLETALLIECSAVDAGAQAVLLYDDGLIATARSVDAFEIAVPEPVDYSTALALVSKSPVLRDADAHPFPSCFVCGPARPNGDGLRIFPAQLSGRDEFVAPYSPLPQFVASEFVWAALDCPSSFPMYLESDPLEGAYVLGRMTAQVGGPLDAHARYTIMAWREAVAGRKLQTAVAMFDANGQTVATAKTTWIRLY